MNEIIFVEFLNASFRIMTADGDFYPP